MPIEISSLQNFPKLKSEVAQRMWKAWWEPAGNSLQTVLDHIDEISASNGIPFGLVAHENGTYVGSMVGIASDLDARLDLTPWVAALWVDEAYRKQGVATLLMNAALIKFFALGQSKVYLNATTDKRGFYQRFGWRLIEEGVGNDKLDVFVIERSDA